MCFQNFLKASACSQLTCLLGSPFHWTRYSITGGTPCLLVTRSARIFFTFFSREASDGCRPVRFRCLECCFLLPIEFTFPLVTSSMCVRATSARSPFAPFTCTPDNKEVLGVLGFVLNWRAPSSCIEPICASSSCSLSSIMALSAFLFGQSRAQCGPSHRKHLILGVNSFLSALPLPSRTLGVLPDPFLGALWSLGTSSPPPMAWLSSKDSTSEEFPLL
ncbi:hypothetical protein PVL29_024634 [Vitis rotundifolia]|uniref:Uncharacterized protein n=1 Tax=Vitis rotundifolia TaxID=103349 RepID=A0AA39DB35_VITRO|nr:hypothetical protein PVL29_024634 [Vitis rotundifolia]